MLLKKKVVIGINNSICRYICEREEHAVFRMKINLKNVDRLSATDAERKLLEGLKRGDNKAYKYLFEKHFVILCGIAYQYVGDTFLSKSIVSDVILHLWEIRDRLSIECSLRKYLVVSVRNKCLDYLKSKPLQVEVSFSEEDCESKVWESDDYPLGKLLEDELEHKINVAIRELPTECRRVFIMSRFGHKKYERISEELGISVPTVKYHMKNAVRLLYAELSKYLLFLLFF